MKQYLLVSLMILTAQFAGAQESVQLDGVAAQVNEHVITIGEVLGTIAHQERMISATQTLDAAKMQLSELYKDAVNELVERYVILDSKDVSEKIKIPDWYVERRAKEIIKESFGGDRIAFDKELSKEKRTYEDWMNELKQHITISYARSFYVDDHVKVSPVMIREFYDKNSGKYKNSPKYKLRTIVIGGTNSESKTKAESIRTKALTEDFSELARKHSVDGYAEDGGDWGWLDKTMLKKELAVVIEKLKPGEISEVTQLSGQLYIIKLEESKDESPAEFEDVQYQIEKDFRRKETGRLYKEWISRLKKQSFISISDINPYK